MTGFEVRYMALQMAQQALPQVAGTVGPTNIDMLIEGARKIENFLKEELQVQPQVKEEDKK